jgi:hypothetical protein
MRTNLLSTLALFPALLTGAQIVLAQSSDEAAVAQAVESLRKAAMAKRTRRLEIAGASGLPALTSINLKNAFVIAQFFLLVISFAGIVVLQQA